MVMSVPPFASAQFESLSRLAGMADRSGIDIRPTLLRVLTDLYIQKAAHSAEEERQFSELALRLIEVVDRPTRKAVAARLSLYPPAPQKVLDALASHLAQENPLMHRPAPATSAAPVPLLEDDLDLFEPAPPQPGTAAGASSNLRPVGFVERRESFFSADAEVRRLILLNLEYAADPEATPPTESTNVLRYLEQAALAGRIQEFTTLLQQSVGVSRATTARIVSDRFGEPFLVAAKAMAMPPAMFQRVVLFLNQAVGHSVERVYELADLFAQLPLSSALHMVAIWRQADRVEAREKPYRPLHWAETEAVRRDARRHPPQRAPERRPVVPFGRRDSSKT